MKNSEIKELSTKELIERLDNERNLLTRMKLNHAVSPLDNPMKIKETRRSVAQMETELSQRQLNEK
ncbi:MAG: 50S ribosomal protein L29 [Bacteroidales bacterium]|nr:50S ribosomal protein L29 [Bacteroidales bacterium]